jgi:hypothetical protein
MTTLHESNNWSGLFEIIQDDLDQVAERLERAGAPQELSEIALHIRRARMGHGHDLRLVEENSLSSDNQNQPADGILLKDEEAVLGRLAEALQLDSRFTSLEGKWFLADKLPRIGRDTLQKFHRILLQNPSASEHEMLSLVKGNGSIDKSILRMALHAALHRWPERFENMGTAAHPQWKARLPEVEQAEVTHYAYDPQTYEMLCRPGQRLSQRKAERLQELKLYAHVVTFAE